MENISFPVKNRNNKDIKTKAVNNENFKLLINGLINKDVHVVIHQMLVLSEQLLNNPKEFSL